MNPWEDVLIPAIIADGWTVEIVQSVRAQRLPGEDGSTDGKKAIGL